MPQPRIFVIDDDASVRKALQRLINSAGMLVETFASAEEFLNARLSLPDCMVLDVSMPGMSGLDLQQHLINKNQDVSLIFICGRDDQDWRRDAMAAGAVDFLIKPFEAQALLASISRTIHTATS